MIAWFADEARKQCGTCNVWRPLNVFHRHAYCQDGYQATCKFCRMEQKIRRRKEHAKRENALGAKRIQAPLAKAAIEKHKLPKVVRSVASNEEFLRDLGYVLCAAMDLTGRSDPFAALYYHEHGTVYDLPDPDQHA